MSFVCRSEGLVIQIDIKLLHEKKEKLLSHKGLSHNLRKWKKVRFIRTLLSEIWSDKDENWYNFFLKFCSVFSYLNCMYMTPFFKVKIRKIWCLFDEVGQYSNQSLFVFLLNPCGLLLCVFVKNYCLNQSTMDKDITMLLVKNKDS